MLCVDSSPSVSQSARQQFLTTSPERKSGNVEPSPVPTAKNAVALQSAAEDVPKHVTNEQFQAMIPAHFVQPEPQPPSSSIVINVKQPDPVGGALSEFQFPAVPTQLGKVTETITKSTLTETIVTRVTNNKLGALPIIIEVQNNNIKMILKRRPFYGESLTNSFFFSLSHARTPGCDFAKRCRSAGSQYCRWERSFVCTFWCRRSGSLHIKSTCLSVQCLVFLLFLFFVNVVTARIFTRIACVFFRSFRKAWPLKQCDCGSVTGSSRLTAGMFPRLAIRKRCRLCWSQQRN